MRTRVVCTLAIGCLIVGLLAGCAATVVRQDTGSLPNAENPEFLFHPFRLAAVGASAAGNILQYGFVEPFYFMMNKVPDFAGLSLEERQYLQEREEAWKQFVAKQLPSKQ